MFESSLLPALVANGTITGIVDEYPASSGKPAIFSDTAPEDATLPYIVFTIEKMYSDNLSIDRFKIDFDYYERGDSKKNARLIGYTIENLLDQASLTHSRFYNIRFYRFNAGLIPGEHPKDIHYNVQMEARADRKGWMSTL